MLEQHLRRAEDVAGRMQRNRDPTDLPSLAEWQLVPAAGCVLAIARLHDGDRVGCREHRAVTGPRVIGVAVRDYGAHLRARGIDVDVDGRDAQVTREEGLGHGHECNVPDAAAVQNLGQAEISAGLASDFKERARRDEKSMP